MRFRLFLAVLVFVACAETRAQSVITERLNDPAAVYLDAPEFHAKGDGSADDTSSLQAAIDQVIDKHHEGIVFVPPGRYRLSRTVYVWAGVRLIGYGEHRPQFLLGSNTPG